MSRGLSLRRIACSVLMPVISTKATLGKTMQSKVVVVAETACARLDEIITEREKVVEELKEEVDGLEAELERIEGKMQ